MIRFVLVLLNLAVLGFALLVNLQMTVPAIRAAEGWTTALESSFFNLLCTAILMGCLALLDYIAYACCRDTRPSSRKI